MMKKMTDRESIKASFKKVTKREPTEAELKDAIKGIDAMTATQLKLTEFITKAEPFPPGAVALLTTTADMIISAYYASDAVSDENKARMTKLLRENANKSMKHILFIV